MGKEQIVEALNRARARELRAVREYMLYHYTAEGLASPETINLFKDTAKVEMTHAEDLGERINYLAGQPVKDADEFTPALELKGMLRNSLKLEEEAEVMYKDIIALCAKEDDPVSRLLMEKILSDEEEHVDTWRKILAGA
jgi:bacterioferritin